MSYNRITWVPAVLRAVGLTVVEYEGWKTRGLSESRPFAPDAIVWHHDASPPGDSPGVPAYMIRNFSTHGAQLWVDRKGLWHIIASGRAAHAGATRSGMPTNETSIGIETDHTTGEGWPPALLTSLRKGSAALLNHLGASPAAGLHFHKTICDPPGRKVDPDGLDLATERSLATALCRDLARSAEKPPTPTGPAQGEPVVLTRLRNAWWNGRVVHWTSFDALINRGAQPDAKAAKVARDKIADAMREFFAEVDQ